MGNQQSLSCFSLNQSAPIHSSENNSTHQVNRLPNQQCSQPVRSPYVSQFESALNSGEAERIRRYLSDHCNDDCILQIDLTALSTRSEGFRDPSKQDADTESHGLKSNNTHIYREIRGNRAIASYFTAFFHAIPDNITLYYQSHNMTKQNADDGSQEIVANCHMIGKQVYGIDVVDDEETLSEQEKLALAVAGLTSLLGSDSSQSRMDDVCNHQSTLCASSTSTSTTSSIVPNESQCNSFAQGKRVTRSLNEMSILIASANNSVEFILGKPYIEPVTVNHHGVFTWFIDRTKKIFKMRFILE
jgi:hypothetical protein